jgi:hypothetical protein
VARLLDRLVFLPWRAVAGAAALTLPMIALPDAASTLRPTLDPVHYPADWSVVARAIGRGDVAVLPWGAYRTFAWAPGRSVLDPAPRLLPAPAVVDDRLAVSGELLAGENRRAARVLRALTAADRPAALARQGVRWVVVEHGTPGSVPDLTGLTRIHDGPDVSLYRVPGAVADVRPSGVRIAVVVVADLLAAGTLLALVAAWAAARAVRRRTRPNTPAAAAAPLL